MEEIVKTLQDLQLEAIKKGVSSFHLDTILRGDGGYCIGIYVRLREDDPDEDCFSGFFFENTTNPEYEIERIKAFINSLN